MTATCQGQRNFSDSRPPIILVKRPGDVFGNPTADGESTAVTPHDGPAGLRLPETTTTIRYFCGNHTPRPNDNDYYYYKYVRTLRAVAIVRQTSSVVGLRPRALRQTSRKTIRRFGDDVRSAHFPAQTIPSTQYRPLYSVR